jgi:hypothetical protein
MKKLYQVRDLSVISHEIPNEKGQMENKKCVEFTVLGNNRRWIDWADYDLFKMLNEDIAI